MDYTALKSTGFAKKNSFFYKQICFLMALAFHVVSHIYVIYVCIVYKVTLNCKKGAYWRGFWISSTYLLLYYRLQFLFYNFVIHWLLHLFRGSHPAATMTCGNLCANLSCLVIKHNRKDGAICFATGFRILLPFYEAVLVVYGQISQRMAP